MQATMATDRSSVLESLRTVLGAPLRRQTYGNIAYLALAAILGQLYFIGFVIGASLGIGLLITLLGLPILVGTLAATTGVASLEARLASCLVCIDISEPEFLSKTSVRDGLVLPGGEFLDAVVSLVTARSTWLSVGLIAVKFVFSIISLVVLPTLLAISAALLATPFVYESQFVGFDSAVTVGAYSVDQWVVETLPEALAVAGGGVIFVIVAINLLNALARLQALSIAVLLKGGANSQ
ncbi:sensor domain-containing protein [Halonotius pteroides]|uniref:Sensor protein n=1 Tax=Halonotius pteroides TaxID=268735 RepID=A0A3A6PYJ8_9EURY|nr:sensor domain-containing protein [Halonotius pteroides]RJX48703.1 sensor protein [Halonotius pteroides]